MGTRVAITPSICLDDIGQGMRRGLLKSPACPSVFAGVLQADKDGLTAHGPESMLHQFQSRLGSWTHRQQRFRGLGEKRRCESPGFFVRKSQVVAAQLLSGSSWAFLQGGENLSEGPWFLFSES